MDPVHLKMEREVHSQPQSHEKAAATVRPAGSVAWVASGIGPRICFAPEGGAGGLAGIVSAGAAAGGEGGAAAGDSGSAATEGAAAGGDGGSSAGADEAGAQKPQRPEWLPESLWDGEKGFKQQDFDDLVASKAERASAEAARPESADAYEVALPETFKLPDHIKVPEGQSIINPDDPRIAELRKVAHEKGWSQQDFQDVLAMGVSLDIAADEKRAESLKAEATKLGSRAQARIESVTSWIDAKVGKDLGSEIKGMLFTAKQVEAFELLMSKNRGDVPGSPGASREQNDPAKIEGFENMSFRQRMAAIEAQKAR